MRLLALLLLFSTNALGAPFLVCDPYPSSGSQPDSFTVALDNGALITVPATINPDGSKQLHYDLGSIGITNGSHTFSVTAVSSVWGPSSQVNFPFVKAVPTAPSGLGLQIN